MVNARRHATFNIAAINMAFYIPVPDEVNGLPVRIVIYADDTQVAISGPPSRLVDIQSGVKHVLDALSGYFLQGGWWHVHEPIPRLISCWLVACKHRQPKVQSVCNQPKVSQRTVHGVWTWTGETGEEPGRGNGQSFKLRVSYQQCIERMQRHLYKPGARTEYVAPRYPACGCEFACPITCAVLLRRER